MAEYYCHVIVHVFKSHHIVFIRTPGTNYRLSFSPQPKRRQAERFLQLFSRTDAHVCIETPTALCHLERKLELKEGVFSQLIKSRLKSEFFLPMWPQTFQLFADLTASLVSFGDFCWLSGGRLCLFGVSLVFSILFWFRCLTDWFWAVPLSWYWSTIVTALLTYVVKSQNMTEVSITVTPRDKHPRVTHCLSLSLLPVSENGEQQIMQPGGGQQKRAAISFSFHGKTVHPSWTSDISFQLCVGTKSFNRI